MREIKYKAWILGKMWEVRGLDWTEDGIIILTDGGFMHLCEEDDVELLEYTGLRDKNGVESYFDDVLKWRDSTFRIVWDDECATVMLKRLSGTDGMSEIPAHNIKQGEVIGNIYENGDLLNGK